MLQYIYSLMIGQEEAVSVGFLDDWPVEASTRRAFLAIISSADLTPPFFYYGSVHDPQNPGEDIIIVHTCGTEEWRQRMQSYFRRCK